MTRFADVFRALGGHSDDDRPIDGISSLSEPRPGTLSFVSTWTESAAEVVRTNPDTLFLVPQEADPTSGAVNVVEVARPRLAFAMIIRDLLDERVPATISSSAVVDESAVLGGNVSIGQFVVVEPGVRIDDDVVIDHHVVLKSGTRIGPRSTVGSHTTIGGAGFGFEMDESGSPIRIGHRGGVEIGSDVEIGQHCSIAQGTIDPTRISDHVKIDDCVFIAHNVFVGAASYIIAGAEISGSVRIGERVWISPEATVINQATIGDDALVGLGAVVVRDVEPNTVVAGVPAKPRGMRHGQRQSD